MLDTDFFPLRIWNYYFETILVIFSIFFFAVFYLYISNTFYLVNQFYFSSSDHWGAWRPPKPPAALGGRSSPRPPAQGLPPPDPRDLLT